MALVPHCGPVPQTLSIQGPELASLQMHLSGTSEVKGSLLWCVCVCLSPPPMVLTQAFKRLYLARVMVLRQEIKPQPKQGFSKQGHPHPGNSHCLHPAGSTLLS